jgi:transposase
MNIKFGKIYFYNRPTDMRKSFDSLGMLVEEEFGDELLSGCVFVFVNRRRTYVKVLYWDEDGFVIWQKRLEQGTFRVKWNGKRELSRREFIMMLEGITPKRLNVRYRV